MAVETWEKIGSSLCIAGSPSPLWLLRHGEKLVHLCVLQEALAHYGCWDMGKNWFISVYCRKPANLINSKHDINKSIFALRISILNSLNTELNPICHLLALLGAHPILHVSRIRVNHVVAMKSMLTSPHSHSSSFILVSYVVHQLTDVSDHLEHSSLQSCCMFCPYFSWLTL